MNRWPIQKRIRFLCLYFASKVALIFEVIRPRGAILWFEWHYSMVNLIHSIFPGRFAQVLYYGPEKIETVNGNFIVRPGTHDAAIVSPAFEREDINYLDINKIGRDQVEIFPFALGHQSGKVEMLFSPSRPGDSSVTATANRCRR